MRRSHHPSIEPGFFACVFAGPTRGARSVIAHALTEIQKSAVRDVLSVENCQKISITRMTGVVRDLIAVRRTEATQAKNSTQTCSSP